MFQRSKLAVAGVVMAMLILLSNNPAAAAVQQTLLTAGTTRYAAVSTDVHAYTTSTSFVDLPGLSTGITIPAGKVGDVMIFFCGDTATGSYTTVRALVGGVAAAPSLMQIRANTSTGGGESGCANFYKLKVASGSPTVKMQWRGDPSYPGKQQHMWERSMIVIVNIH